MNLLKFNLKAYLNGFIKWKAICVMGICTAAAQSKKVERETSNFQKTNLEQHHTISKCNRNNYCQLNLNNVKNIPNAEQCVLRIDELNASVVRLEQRRLMLAKNAENVEKMRKAIDVELGQLNEEIRYLNNILISIKACENQKVPTAIYDGSLAGDESKRVALKSSYYTNRSENYHKVSISRTLLETLPTYKQNAIVGDTLHYTIIE
ncbi:MAG: hypothetical protein ACK5B6_07650 [Bacteroidia bacterium]|jgi:hypothetical protein